MCGDELRSGRSNRDSGQGSHRYQRLRRRRVDPHGAAEIGLGGAGVDGDREAPRDFRRVFAQHGGANHVPAGLVDHRAIERLGSRRAGSSGMPSDSEAVPLSLFV